MTPKPEDLIAILRKKESRLLAHCEAAFFGSTDRDSDRAAEAALDLRLWSLCLATHRDTINEISEALKELP